MHKMYKISTQQGIFALKLLNPFVMQRINSCLPSADSNWSEDSTDSSDANQDITDNSTMAHPIAHQMKLPENPQQITAFLILTFIRVNSNSISCLKTR